MINSTSKDRKKIFFTIFIIGFICFLIYLNQKSPVVTFFQDKVQLIFDGPRKFVYGLGKKDRDDEISRLKSKIQQLQEKLINYEIVKKDNEALRSQFDDNGEMTQSLVSAKIVGFIGENQKPFEFVIDAGRKQGLEEGMSVIFKKYLVGKISKVTDTYSVVETVYSNKFQVLAKLVETNASGIVLGRNDLLLFDGVVITDTLKKDGIVTTKGEVGKNGIGVIPDMIVGKILSISKKETAPFQNAQLIPLIDYSKLTVVFVVKKM